MPILPDMVSTNMTVPPGHRSIRLFPQTCWPPPEVSRKVTDAPQIWCIGDLLLALLIANSHLSVIVNIIAFYMTLLRRSWWGVLNCQFWLASPLTILLIPNSSRRRDLCDDEEPTQAYFSVRRGVRRGDNEGESMNATWYYGRTVHVQILGYLLRGMPIFHMGTVI